MKIENKIDKLLIISLLLMFIVPAIIYFFLYTYYSILIVVPRMSYSLYNLLNKAAIVLYAISRLSGTACGIYVLTKTNNNIYKINSYMVIGYEILMVLQKIIEIFIKVF